MQKICLECTNKLVFDGAAWLVDSPAIKEILMQQRPMKSTFTTQPYFTNPGTGQGLMRGNPGLGFYGLRS